MIDTHAHIYGPEFDLDRDDVIQRAKQNGLDHIVLANVDQESLAPLLALTQKYPELCIPSIGLHPTSVDQNYQATLASFKKQISHYPFRAIGEIGLDLYWDKTFLQEQVSAFETQLDWALEYNLPVIVHVREAYELLHQSLAKYKGSSLTGIIHSFSGNVEDAEKILQVGNFLFGINGIVTFKKSVLPEVIQQIGLSHLVVETDCPYLSPVPYRGKRNEPAYVVHTAQRIADIFQIPLSEVDRQTTQNAKQLFKI